MTEKPSRWGGRGEEEEKGDMDKEKSWKKEDEKQEKK
jgi:hypothetical protein